VPDIAARFGSFGDECSEVGALFELMSRRPDWYAAAACVTAPSWVSWFPQAGGRSKAATAVCAGCPVRVTCTAWAMAQGPQLKGIWGGLSERERNARRRAAAGDLAILSEGKASA